MAEPSPEDLPELVKLGRWAYRHIHQEADMVRTAPLALIIALCFGAFLSWWVTNSLLAERMAAYEVGHKYDSERLASYEKAFPGRSPDEAAKEMAALRDSLTQTGKRLDMMETAAGDIATDRHITENQKRILVQEIKRLKSWQLPTLIVSSVDDPEADQYAIQFIRLFKDNDIPVQEEYADPPDNTLPTPRSVRELSRETGISISVRYPENPPESAKLFYVALWKAKLWPVFERFYGDFPSEFMFTVRYKPMRP